MVNYGANIDRADLAREYHLLSSIAQEAAADCVPAYRRIGICILAVGYVRVVKGHCTGAITPASLCNAGP